MEQYHVDLAKVSLGEFRRILEAGTLLPSERILGERMDERFAILESAGIANLQDLDDRLGTKKKLAQFAEESGMPEKYLVVLRRRAGTYAPKPVPLNKFPGVDQAHVERLGAVGVKHSEHLFARARLKHERAELAAQVNVPEDALLELVKLSDLVRAPYVGPVYARIIYETGVDRVSKLAEQRPEVLFEKALAVNREQQLTRASFTLKDVEACIETAKSLPKVIEY